VLSVDETTTLQPRPRRHPARPAQPHDSPDRPEHAYRRAGARNRLAAFETRSGKVYGYCAERQRPQDCMAFLEPWDREMEAPMWTIHLVCDHVSTPHGKDVRMWIAKHARFVLHLTPVHCSWMNHVEQGFSMLQQGFSMLQRTRLRMVDFESKDHLRAKLEPFIAEWHACAHSFNWSTKSVAKVMAEAPTLAALYQLFNHVRCTWLCARSAHPIRAFLLASVTAARFFPRRSMRALSHQLWSSCFVSTQHRMARAP
jgi:hypothetical protein